MNQIQSKSGATVFLIVVGIVATVTFELLYPGAMHFMGGRNAVWRGAVFFAICFVEGLLLGIFYPEQKPIAWVLLAAVPVGLSILGNISEARAGNPTKMELLIPELIVLAALSGAAAYVGEIVGMKFRKSA